MATEKEDHGPLFERPRRRSYHLPLVAVAVTSALIVLLSAMGYYALVGEVFEFGVLTGLMLGIVFFDVVILAFFGREP